jgi:hypothetical protein
MLISLRRGGRKEFNKNRLVRVDIGRRGSVHIATQLDKSATVNRTMDGRLTLPSHARRE